MTPTVYVLDTHTLFWREFHPKRLPPTVSQVFLEALAGRAVIVLLPIVLAEFYYVLRKEGLEQDAPLYLQYVHEVSGYRLEALNLGRHPATAYVPGGLGDARSAHRHSREAARCDRVDARPRIARLCPDSLFVVTEFNYWSKKPHDAIRQYVRHYTQPGDLVLGDDELFPRSQLVDQLLQVGLGLVVGERCGRGSDFLQRLGHG